MKIHFACLFGVDYELDFLHCWSKHYTDMRLDSYKVFLHREKGSIGQSIINEFKHLGFSVEIAPEGFHGNGTLRKLILSNYASSLPSEDFLVTADADELQCVYQQPPGHPVAVAPDYRELLQHYDIISGFMVDRYSSSLQECHEDPLVQYPYEELFTGEILKNFTPPYLQKTSWPFTRRTKILASRAGYNVAYEGSHCLLDTPLDASIASDYKVLHFAWRESARRKVSIKSYYTRENLNEVYEGSIPENIEENYRVLNTLSC
jgi:hypothetical protein